MPYMYALYVCRIRMPYMYALYVCLIQVRQPDSKQHKLYRMCSLTIECVLLPYTGKTAGQQAAHVAVAGAPLHRQT